MNKTQMLESVRNYLSQFGKPDEKILKAMAQIDRADFMPFELRERAYIDTAMPIGNGQTISQPSTVARMLGLLELEKGDKVLEVGAGSGWNAGLIWYLVSDFSQVLSNSRFAFEVNNEKIVNNKSFPCLSRNQSGNSKQNLQSHEALLNFNKDKISEPEASQIEQSSNDNYNKGAHPTHDLLSELYKNLSKANRSPTLSESKINGSVLSLEIVSELAERTRENLIRVGIKNIKIEEKDFRNLKEKFDKIIFTAGILSGQEEEIVNFGSGHLQDNGILICPFQYGPLVILKKSGGKIVKEYTKEEYVFVPLVL